MLPGFDLELTPPFPGEKVGPPTQFSLRPLSSSPASKDEGDDEGEAEDGGADEKGRVAGEAAGRFLAAICLEFKISLILGSRTGADGFAHFPDLSPDDKHASNWMKSPQRRWP